MNAPTRSRRLAWLNRVGTWLTVGCAIHCLLTPLAIGLLPLVGLSIVAEPVTEWVILTAAGATVLASALWGLKRHREERVVIAVAGAFAVVLLGHALGHEQWYGQLIAVVGAVCVAAAQLVGARLCQRCDADSGHCAH